MLSQKPPKADVSALLQASYPEIDIKVGSLFRATNHFKSLVHDFSETATVAITEKEREHGQMVKKLAEKTAFLEKQIRAAQLREIEMSADLEREREEQDRTEDEVNGLRRDRDAIHGRAAGINKTNEQARALLNDIQREKNDDITILNKHAASLVDQYKLLSRLLGVRIDGVGREALLFTFSINATDRGSRECSFALDLSGDNYRVLASDPMIPDMVALLAEANATGDVWKFIAKAHKSFTSLLQGTGSG